MIFRSILTSTILLGALHATGAPEAFTIMDSNTKKLSFKIQKKNNDSFPNVSSELKKKHKFLCSIIDGNMPISVNVTDTRPYLDLNIKGFVTQGNYITRRLMLHAYSGLKNIKIQCSKLVDDNGNQIAVDNIKLMRIEKAVGNKHANFLISPDVAVLPAKRMLQYMLMFYAPKNAVAGLYRGEVKIKCETENFTLPVQLRVLNLKLPEPNISLGFFLPAYAHSENQNWRANWAQKWACDDYTYDQLNRYFQFWKTRNLNSPTLFHSKPEFAKKGKDFKLKFDQFDFIASAMNKNNLTGHLIIDLRFFTDWAIRAAKDSKIANGRNENEIFKTMVRQLIAHAEKTNWPPLLLMVEEEISNSNVKKKRYNKFWKSLREVVGPERDIILDNDIGYNRSNAIDRGARDGYKHRQYNSWEKAGIDRVKKDNAEVWTYNLGFQRLGWGYTLVKYNSQGNHKWADKWRMPMWSISFSTPKGIISSLQFENAHAGITDFRFIQKFKEKISKLRQDGKLVEADKLKQLLLQQIADIPYARSRQLAMARNLPDSKLDYRRWQIARCLIEPLSNTSSEGKTECFLTAEKSRSSLDKKQKKLTVSTAPDNYRLNGKVKNSWWKGTGPLRITLKREAYLMATTASMEEFRKKSVISYSGAWVAYNQKGLLLGLKCNHILTSKYVAKYQDGDADMWRENCMEFFFAPDDKHSYQLIVNPKGNKVMISTRGNVAPESIRVVTVSPINKSGGYSQEIFIPWKTFGIKTMPTPGTIWKFNVGREFHRWNQLSSWTGVFGKKALWGFIVFDNKNYRYFKNLLVSPVYPGKNIVNGKIGLIKKGNVILELSNTKKSIKRLKITQNKRDFSFLFNHDPRRNKAEEYALTLKINGKVAEQYKFKSIPVTTPVTPVVTSLEAFAGEFVNVAMSINLSSLERSKNALQILIIDNKGRTIWSAEKPFADGNINKLWLNTSGIKPGNYKIHLSCRQNKDYFQKMAEIKLKLIPSPYQ